MGTIPRLLIISPYPHGEDHYSHRTSALASFTANLFASLSPEVKKETLILADRNDEYTDTAHVKRVWTRSDVWVFLRLIRTMTSLPTRTILIQYEWNMFGSGVWWLAGFPFFLLSLRLLGKRVTTVSHAVLLQADTVEKNTIKASVMQVMARCFYALVLLFSTRVVVLEEYLRTQLIKTYPWFRTKIVVIPHGVDTQLHVSDDIIRPPQTLGYFGFITFYKGTDRLTKAFLSSVDYAHGTKLQLVGGISHHGKNDDLASRIKSDISASSGRIEITGFLPMHAMVKYMASCTLAIFPYRTLLSSSGPLSLMFSTCTPFRLSRELTPYLESRDFHEAFIKSKLKVNELFIDLTTVPHVFIPDASTLQKLRAFASLMRRERDWDHVAKQYEASLGV